VDAPTAAPGATEEPFAAGSTTLPAEAADLAQSTTAAVAASAVAAPDGSALPPRLGPDGPATAGARGHGHPNGGATGHTNGQDRANGCTAPQLRRFIKSRPYVPMHELRRRFAIDGGDDEVTQVSIAQGHVYVGLPPREGSLLGELLRGGEIGYELSLDPRTPVVVGVYPMRPVPRS
jgi:hypothetical protein